MTRAMAPQPPGARTAFSFTGAGSRLLSFNLWLIVCALWVCARPYRGVRHDGLLYLAQVFHRLDPATYGADLFFRYGSQDRFSIFSLLMAPLVRHWGVTPVECGVLFLAQAALLAAVARLFDAAGLRAWRWPALLMLACFPHIYGGLGTLGFAEPFLTARTLAEPLAVWTLVALLRKRWGSAFVLAAAASMMHPIVTLPVLVVAWVMLSLENRRWLWAAAVVPLILGLAAAGFAPFDALLQRFDATWWNTVHVRNSLVFVSQWLVEDHQSTVLDLLILAVAWRLASHPAQSRLCLASLLSAASLLAVSLLGADLAHDVLITQSQLWRVMWWVHMFTLALTPWLVAALWTGSRTRKAAALACVVAILAIGADWATGWVFVSMFAAALAADARGYVLSTSLFRAVAACLALAVLTMSAVLFVNDLQTITAETSRIADVAWYRVLFAVPAMAIAIGGLAVLVQSGQRRVIGTAVAAGLVAIAATQWDQRSTWTTYVDSAHATPHPFDAIVPAGEPVFWIDDVTATWFVLHRPSYFSRPQGSGLLFNRATAVEYERRASAFAPLVAQQAVCSIMTSLGGDPSRAARCFPTLPAVEPICRLADGPRFLVFKTPLERGVVARWRFEGANVGERADYFLHDCKQILGDPL